jgi:hypothetical protein
MSETSAMSEALAPEAVPAELEALLEGRLRAVYRFGSTFATKPGLTRLLVLVDALDRDLLDRLTPLVGRCQQALVRLRLDTVEEILQGADTFPVFCLEFRETRELVSGEDVLAGIKVDTGTLRLRVEQGLRVVRRDLVQAYLDQTDAGLGLVLRRATHRLLYLFEGALLIGDEFVQRTPLEVFEALASKHLDEAGLGILRRLHAFGSFEASLDDDALLELYADLLGTLRKVVDAIDALEG